MLSIVSTPIGNLEDITLRALRTLKEVDLIAAEDTRHTGILLHHFEISKPLLSFHSHSGQMKLDKIMEALHQGKNVALVSDAGTPGISDPGYLLIRRAIEEKIPITAIPGASALLPALVTSGLPIDKFVYLGFLPLKKGRKTLLESLKQEERTVVFYESPHRLHKTLGDLQTAGLGDFQLVLARELTKIYETVYRGTVSSLAQSFAHQKLKGEMVMMLFHHKIHQSSGHKNFL